jgi:rare lipoprotein A
MINRLGAIQAHALASRLAVSGVLGITLAGLRPPCAQADARPYAETGMASWYGAEFAGRQTACGEVFDPGALTAAHQTLPFGTLVRITNLSNGRSVVARINDRGPFVSTVILDCSHAVARVLGFVREGLTSVRITDLNSNSLARDEVLAESGPSTGGAMPAASAAMVRAAPAQPAVRVASSPPAVGASSRAAASYCVQIGAYKDPTNADTQLRKASLLSVPVFMHQTQRFFHVLVGPLPDRPSALETQVKLQHAGVTGYVRMLAQ